MPLILWNDCLRVDFKWDVEQIIFMRLAGNQVCNKWEKTSVDKDL